MTAGYKACLIREHASGQVSQDALDALASGWFEEAGRGGTSARGPRLFNFNTAFGF
jgi:hypothetical protein